MYLTQTNFQFLINIEIIEALKTQVTLSSSTGRDLYEFCDKVDVEEFEFLEFERKSRNDSLCDMFRGKLPRSEPE